MNKNNNNYCCFIEMFFAVCLLLIPLRFGVSGRSSKDFKFRDLDGNGFESGDFINSDNIPVENSKNNEGQQLVEQIQKLIPAPQNDFQNSVKDIDKSKKLEDVPFNSNTSSTFADKVLIQHNKYRKIHGVPPLQLNNEISQVSQEWADKLATSGMFYHRPNGKYGENLYYYWHSNSKFNLSPNLPVDGWYEEISDYKYGGTPDYTKTGHFTQLVWKKSKDLGVGYSKYGNTHVVVCNYNPRGNYLGKYNENVFPPQ